MPGTVPSAEGASVKRLDGSVAARNAPATTTTIVVRIAARFISMHKRTNAGTQDRKSTRLNSSHLVISYAVFCLKKKKKESTQFSFICASLHPSHPLASHTSPSLSLVHSPRTRAQVLSIPQPSAERLLSSHVLSH